MASAPGGGVGDGAQDGGRDGQGGPGGTATPVVLHGGLSRRQFLGASAMLPLLRHFPPSTIAAAYAEAGDLRFFDEHQAAVVTEATARLIPGPTDDPSEEGHPGAREAGVVVYIDLLLSAFDDDPPRIFAGGPHSDRAGGSENLMATFVPLSLWQEELWRTRIGDLQDRYRRGIAALDEAAGGDFATATREQMDQILVADGAPDSFRRLLFEHAIEGTYSIPEYGGNHELVGWTETGSAGDVAPTGWTAEEVTEEVLDQVPDDVELPFPPDMAETGTDDPLGEADDTSTASTASAAGRSGAEPADAEALVRRSDEWFAAAVPMLARSRRRPRGGRA
jgi:hypothetical protein